MPRSEKKQEKPRASRRILRRSWLQIIISVVVIVALLIYLFRPGPGIGPLDPGQPPPYDFLGDTTILGGLYIFEPVYNPCTEDYRPDYGLSCEEQQTIFGQLPKFPADLLDVAKGYYEGRLSLDRLILDHPQTQAAQYWKQPEFYPGWNRSFLEIQRQPPEPIWTPYGYNFYPWGVGAIVGRSSPEAERGWFTLKTFLRAGWGTDTWQGFHTYPIYPKTALKQDGTPLLDDKNETITQDPSTIPFSVSIQSSSDPYYLELMSEGVFEDDRREGGQFFVMPPSHPSFTAQWVKLLELRIQLEVPAYDLSPGFWFFTLEMSNAAFEVNQEYFIMYGNFYQASGEWPVESLTPLLHGFIVVV